MTVFARVYVTHENLALTGTIRSLSDAEISVVSDAGTDPYHDVYYIWIEAPDFDAVANALAEDHTVAEFSAITDGEPRRTYRIEYSAAAKLISPLVTEVGAVTVDARSHVNGWLLELQLQTHDGLYELDEYARAEGISLDVLELRQTESLDDRSDLGLTDEQREALMAAYVHGRYDEPRGILLEELADLLDISQSAVSGRLRRGSARLVEEVLVDDES